MTKFNIIFLDVDGVLNNAYSMMAGPNILFDPATVSRLKQIITFTNSRIVLSTAWRLKPDYKKALIDELDRKGIDRKLIIGQTPSFAIIDKTREDEILFWVRRHQDKVKNWVAIDDLNLKRLPMSHFVQTQFYTGLTEKKAGEVISKIIFQ